MERKLTIILIACAMVLPVMRSQAQEKTGSRTLIVYYSWGGNTRSLVQQIQSLCKVDVLEVLPEQSYPTDYKQCVDQAKEEIRNNHRPALSTPLPNLQNYDVILVASPNWWGTIAPPMATLLEGLKFDGKVVIPVITHGGGGIQQCEADIKKLCPGASFREALCLRGSSDMKKHLKKVERWTQELGL